MNKLDVRRSRETDAQALKALWSKVFGDKEKDINAFFDMFFEDICIVIEAQQRISAMGFLLPAGYLRVPGEADIRCDMIYAVATEPSMRGLGCGELIVRSLLESALKKGTETVVLHPAEDSLFGYYEQKVNMKTAFYCLEELIAPPPKMNGIPIRRISADEYAAIRENMLKDMAHLTLGEKLFKYQQYLCGDGGFFASDSGKQSCAIVETHNGYVRIVELLESGGGLLEAIMEEFPAEHYFVRRPGNNLRFGMISGRASNDNAWFGPAFD